MKDYPDKMTPVQARMGETGDNQIGKVNTKRAPSV